VRVGGAGPQFDDFHGEATAGPDGAFTIDVNPDKYYMLVASKDRLASAPHRQVVRRGEPPAAAVLELKPATRVFGRVTGGPERKPLAGESVSFMQQDGLTYFNLPEEQRIAGTESRT
jgi:hypothetical protein